MAELQAIGSGDGAGFICEAEVVQDRVQKIARTVTGEDPSGAVGSMGSGSKPEDQDAGVRIAKARHGTRPVGPVAINDVLASEVKRRA